MEDLRQSPIFRFVMERMQELDDGSDVELLAALQSRMPSIDIARTIRQTVNVSVGERTIDRWKRAARYMNGD